MRKIVANWMVATGAGLVLMAGLGCKKQAAPAPVAQVLRVPQVQTDFLVGSLPVGSLGPFGAPKVEAPIVRQPAPVAPELPAGEDPQAAAEEQRREDAALLQQQEADSARQQQELNQEIDQEMQRQQQIEDEPRIQSTPVESTPSWYEWIQPQPGPELP